MHSSGYQNSTSTFLVPPDSSCISLSRHSHRWPESLLPLPCSSVSQFVTTQSPFSARRGPVFRTGRGECQTSGHDLFSGPREEKMAWFAVVLSRELAIVVIVLSLPRGLELTTQSCITRKNGKPFPSSSGAQVCRGGRRHKNGSREQGGDEAPALLWIQAP